MNQQEIEQTKERLKKLYPVGACVNVVLTHVSKSGMLRRYIVLANLDGTDRLTNVSFLMRALGMNVKEGEIIVRGCGFCGADEISSTISSALHGDKGITKSLTLNRVY